MLRPVTLHDLKSLEGEVPYPLPNVNDPLFFYQIAMDDENGQFLGILMVRLTTEISMIFKRDISTLKKTKAVLEAWEPLEQVHARNGLDDTYVFLLGEEKENLEKTLKKLGFVNAIGIPLYYKARSKQWPLERRKRQLDKRRTSQEDHKKQPTRHSTEVQLVLSGLTD